MSLPDLSGGRLITIRFWFFLKISILCTVSATSMGGSSSYVSGRKQPSFQSVLNLLISHNRSKQRFFRNRYIPINSCCFSVDWSTNWCKWCISFLSSSPKYSLLVWHFIILAFEIWVKTFKFGLPKLLRYIGIDIKRCWNILMTKRVLNDLDIHARFAHSRRKCMS